MNDVDEVRGLLASALEGDAGPRHSPEEVLRSARKASAQRRAVVASALSVGVVLVTGAGVLVSAQAPSTVEPAAGAMLTTAQQAPGAVPPVPVTAEHAAELTAKLSAAGVIPADYRLSQAAGAQAGPLQFYGIGADSSDGYKATAVVDDGTGRSTLTVFVRSVSEPPECTPENHCTSATPVSTPSDAPPTTRSVDGAEVVVTRVRGTGEVAMMAVNKVFPDGTVVHATVRSWVDDGPPLDLSPGGVPFTEQQLIDVALKPGFTY